WGYAAADFTSRGYHVLMPDYRSYGKSEGQLDYEALRSDARLFYNWVAKQYPADQIVLYGRSMGTGVATDLAIEVPAQQLILETPYTSINDMARIRMGFLPVDLLLRYPFSNLNKLKQVKCPFHLLHGTQDELIPYQHAVRLAEQFPGQQVLTTIPNGGHNNLSEFEIFQNRLNQLLP
ncbi:MAG: alpha/beta hydrolase, partial [Bacteroidota bacterium]